MSLNIDWLEREAKRLGKKYWGSEAIPTIHIDKNLEKEDWLAVYRSKSKSIHFSYDKNKNRTKSELRKILLHELCHWNLHKKNKPYDDSDVEFALELLRVRAASTCNNDKESIKAMKEARKIKKQQRERRVFELRDSAYDLDIILRHRNKTREEFKEDVKRAMIGFYNDTIKQCDENNTDYYGFSLEELADMMCEWYGYERVDFHIVESISFTSECYGNIGFRESLVNQLSYEFGMDIETVEDELLPEKKYVY